MKIAVLTLTRDRLHYTRQCFGILRAKAGCKFDHFVLDQGSTDGTDEWLQNEYKPVFQGFLKENIGIMHGIKYLLNQVNRRGGYDVIVKFDNDCEILTPDCLRHVAEATLKLNALLSPTIHGLRSPPQVTHSSNVEQWKVNHVSGNIGGIFLSAPADFYDGWQDTALCPKWGMDDVLTCQKAHDRGMIVGYLDGYEANHYRTTDGQHEDYPEYFERRVREGGPS